MQGKLSCVDLAQLEPSIIEKQVELKALTDLKNCAIEEKEYMARKDIPGLVECKKQQLAALRILTEPEMMVTKCAAYGTEIEKSMLEPLKPLLKYLEEKDTSNAKEEDLAHAKVMIDEVKGKLLKYLQDHPDAAVARMRYAALRNLAQQVGTKENSHALAVLAGDNGLLKPVGQNIPNFVDKIFSVDNHRDLITISHFLTELANIMDEAQNVNAFGGLQPTADKLIANGDLKRLDAAFNNVRSIP